MPVVNNISRSDLALLSSVSGQRLESNGPSEIPSYADIAIDDITGLTDALAAKADTTFVASGLAIKANDASVVHSTGAVAETVTGPKTFTATLTASVSSTTLATTARMVNPDPSVINGSYSFAIGGAGNFNGELQLIRDTIGQLARFNTNGITLPGGKSYSADTNGGLVYLQNGNTAATFDTSGLNLSGVTRIVSRIAGTTVASITATLSYFTPKLVVGATALGSAGAQLESRAPDATTPIFTGYTNTGAAAFQVGPSGITALSELRIGSNNLAVRQSATQPFAIEFPGAAIYSNVASFGGNYDGAIRLRITGIGATNATKSLYVNDSAGLPTLTCLDDRRVLVGSNTAGSIAAQLEVKAKDASTPIFAAYTNLGAAPFIVDASGNPRLLKGTQLLLPDSNCSIRVDDSPAWSTGSNNVMTIGVFNGRWVFRNTSGGAVMATISASSGNLTLAGALIAGQFADVNIPNGGIAWSTDTPGALKARDLSGVLSTLN